MINCPKCGGLNAEGSLVCGACGTSLQNSNESEPNNIPTTEAESMRYVENDVQIESNNQASDQSSNENVYDPNAIQYDNQVLVNYYIGNNVDKLRNGGFSWATFFMGAFYVWYRKMYKLLGIWIGINFAIGFIFGIIKMPYVSGIASFILTIVMSVKFKKLYIDHVYEEIEKIKTENEGSTQEELNEICAKKGKPTIIPAILYVGFIIFIVGLLVLMIVPIISTILGLNIKGPSLPIPTSSYLDTAKSNAYIENANRAIEAVRNDIAVYGFDNNSNASCTSDMCIYNQNQINNLVELKIETSPFGGKYQQVVIKVTKDISGSPEYSICMVDSNKNGFGYTSEDELSVDTIQMGTASPSC